MKHLKDPEEFKDNEKLISKEEPKNIHNVSTKSTFKKKKKYIEDYFTILRHIGDIP